MWWQVLFCKFYIAGRLEELGFDKPEIKRIMQGITGKRYYRTWGRCQHCGNNKVIGRFGYIDAPPPGSATAVGARARIHEGLFCINCGVEFDCRSRVKTGERLSDRDFDFFKYICFATHEFNIRKDGLERNFFDVLRKEADISETYRLGSLVGEREWLRGRLCEVEGQIKELEGAEEILAELEEIERPKLSATNG